MMSVVTIGWPEPLLAETLRAAGQEVEARPAQVGQDWTTALAGHEIAVVRESTTADGGRSATDVASFLVAACDAGVRRLVYVTELGYDMDVPAGELSPAALAQAEVQAASLDWTVLRMAPHFGPADDLVRALARVARWLPVVPLPAAGGWHVQPLAVRDAADAVVAVLGDPLTVGGVYELAGPEVLGLAELLDRILAALDARRGVMMLPEDLVRRLWLAVTWPSRGTVGLGHMMELDRVAADNRAAALLGRPLAAADPAALAYLRA